MYKPHRAMDNEETVLAPAEPQVGEPGWVVAPLPHTCTTWVPSLAQQEREKKTQPQCASWMDEGR